MPPPLRICAFRPRPNLLLRPSNAVIGVKRAAGGIRRHADHPPGKLPEAPKDDPVGPNMQQQEHVSEEAAKVAKIQGQEGPDVEQGTPVQEILKEEKDTREQAPKVLKEQVQSTTTNTGGKRSFSTYSRRNLEVQPTASSTPIPPSLLLAQYSTPNILPEQKAGHKFPLPDLPLPSTARKDQRYEPIVDQVTNLLMRDGKKSVAQRNMAIILSTLRTSPAPTYSPTRKLLPGAPPASHLPLSPVLYLTLALDSVAPLMRLRSQRGAAGGGMALQIPVPLGLRQRRRQAFMWILEAAEKRRNMGSGRDTFAHRVAQELIAVVEGRSSIWEKRQGIHRLATTNRMNLNWRRVGFRR